MPSQLENIDLSNAAVIGFEMSTVDIHYLNQENIPWINLAIHPIRFLDDLYLDVRSSFDYQYSHLGADLGVIEFCVNSLRNRYAGYNENQNKLIKLAIFGQSPADKSVFFDGNFYSLDSYFSELDALVSEQDEVIYRPHPYATNAKIDDVIFKKYNAIDGSARNVYEMLASGDISTACAISSSVISESQYFGVRSVFLDPRAQKFGPAISYKKLVDESLFWQRLLDTNSSSQINKISVVVPNNYLRQVFASWGYLTREDELVLNYQSSAKIASDAVELSKHVLADSQHMQQEVNIKCAQIESVSEQTQERVKNTESKAERIQLTVDQTELKVVQVKLTADQADSTARHALSKAEQTQLKVEQVDSKVELIASQSDLMLDWIQHRESELKQQLYLAESRADEHIQRAIAAEQHADYWHQEANKWHTRVLDLHSSTSWVITKPLRLFKRILKFDLSYFRGFSLVLKIKRAVHRFVIYFAPFVLKHPKLKRKLRTILARYPRIYHKIQTIAVKAGLFAQHFEKNNSSPYSFVFDASLCDSLTPDALDIYKKLQIAINNKNKEC